MAAVLYCIQSGDTLTDEPTDPIRVRADQFGAGVCVGDGSYGIITVWPSLVVTSPLSTPVVFPDDTGEAVPLEVATALAAASAIESAAAATITQANANLAVLVGEMSGMVAQGHADLTSLAASTDPLAAILARNIEGSLALAQGLADTLVALKLIAATEVSVPGA